MMWNRMFEVQPFWRARVFSDGLASLSKSLDKRHVARNMRASERDPLSLDRQPERVDLR